MPSARLIQGQVLGYGLDLPDDSRALHTRTLEAGEAELAVGYFPDLHRAGFFQQKLFDNPHVCLVRRGHPDIGERLTLKAYLAAAHAIVRPGDRQHVFEQFLEQ